MSNYQESRKLALANMQASEAKLPEIALIYVLCGVVHALLCIAAAISDLKP